MNVQYKAQPINMVALCWTFIGSAVLCYAYAGYGWIRLCSHCCRRCHFIFVYVQWTM